MQRLLVVETSPRGDASISRQLTRRFVAQWRLAHPGAEVTRRDLTSTSLPFVTADFIPASLTPPAQQTDEMKAVLTWSDELVAELLAADHIVIATPVYNYNVPASLKAWIDHVVRKGVTLGMDGSGLLTGKRATLLIASGGIYTEGSPIRERDIATAYLRLILSVIGITDVSVIAAGGAKAVDLGEIDRDTFLDRFGREIEARVA